MSYELEYLPPIHRMEAACNKEPAVLQYDSEHNDSATSGDQIPVDYGLRVYSPSLAQTDGHEAYIDTEIYTDGLDVVCQVINLYVPQELGRLGIGTKLVTVLTRALLDHGVSKLESAIVNPAALAIRGKIFEPERIQCAIPHLIVKGNFVSRHGVEVDYLEALNLLRFSDEVDMIDTVVDLTDL